jgi:hypothetical protein
VIRGSVARGLSVSVLFHVLLALSGLIVLPVVNRMLGGDRPLPEAPVLTFHIDDILAGDNLADVAPSSAVDEEVDSPLLGEYNSKAHDMVDGDTGNPVPDGGVVALDNSIEGTMADQETGTETQGEELAQPDMGAPPQEDPTEEGAAAETAEMTVLERIKPLDKDESAVPSANAMLTGVPEPPERPGHGDQVRSDLGPRGADVGEFSFSTKAWDWEPYWVHMKRRLYRAWIPPAAYAQYGMLEGGYTLVRAVIERDGSVSSVEVLEDRQGHRSLHQSSYSAMVGAAPFRPLPPGFPDDHLVVTVRFIYLDPDRGGLP